MLAARDEQCGDDADQRPSGHGQQDDERMQQRLELHRHDDVDQEDGEAERQLQTRRRRLFISLLLPRGFGHGAAGEGEGWRPWPLGRSESDAAEIAGWRPARSRGRHSRAVGTIDRGRTAFDGHRSATAVIGTAVPSARRKRRLGDLLGAVARGGGRA